MTARVLGLNRALKFKSPSIIKLKVFGPKILFMIKDMPGQGKYFL
jgi:hypothetical protein